ncbi:MAG: hypothetical protein A2V66_00695 [Ignavibacteria bacterium RBG_13_36_8]|nr:MAG: hypothetical protein A2V66_00695 [Ignavibacteria bacterium RBG_13_36_8]
MQTDELLMIIKAAELINSNVRLDEVLKNIVDVAINLTKADRGTLYLVDKDKNELWSLVAVGTEIKEIRLRMGEGLAGYVAQSGETINIKDARKDSRFKSDFDRSSGYVTRSMICFPIKNNDNEIVGVLQLLNSRNGEFSTRDENFLKALSIHSAIAIHNALMHQKQIWANEEIKKAYKELELAKQEAEKFAMLRSHFLSQISHEVRTPLNIMMGSVQLLKLLTGSNQSDDINEAFQMLESGSTRLTRTIDEIVELSEIKCGSYEIHIEPINFEKEILSSIVEEYKKRANEKGIDLIFKKLSVAEKINGDRFMIYKILQEIIDNAVKFTEKGSVTIKQFLNDENKLSVSIKDTGIGISDEYQEHIFEPFTQEKTGSTRKYEGNGLALALVKQYAELNNIEIKIYSEKNVGTEFTVVFP